MNNPPDQKVIDAKLELVPKQVVMLSEAARSGRIVVMGNQFGKTWAMRLALAKPIKTILSAVVCCLFSGCDNATLNSDIAQARTLQRQTAIFEEELAAMKRQADALERIADALEKDKK